MKNEEKATIKVQIGETLGVIALLFTRPWVFNKAILALINAGIALPVFTYWQMFFMSWALIMITKIIGNIFHK